VSGCTSVCRCVWVQRAVTTSSSATTQVGVFQHDGSVTATTTVETCLMNRTVASPLHVSIAPLTHHSLHDLPTFCHGTPTVSEHDIHVINSRIHSSVKYCRCKLKAYRWRLVRRWNKYTTVYRGKSYTTYTTLDSCITYT